MSEIRALIEQLVNAGVDPIEAAEVVARAAIHGAAAAPKARSAGAVRQNFNENEWQRRRAIVFERDGYVCVYCGSDVSENPQCDHVVPLILGGSNEIDNLATACKRCNSSKAGRHPNEWRPSWQ